MQDIQTFSIMIATTGLLVGILYHINTLRNAKQTRQAQLYMQFLKLGMDKDLLRDLLEVNELDWKDAAELGQWYYDLEHKIKFRSVLAYYTGLGTMVKENLIKLDIVPDIFTIAVRDFWEKYQPAFAALPNSPYAHYANASDMVEYLYREILEGISKQ
ncbi:MAG: hypothetical protein ACFFD9_08410 [Candidatus Thorarchaeota archaeon]